MSVSPTPKYYGLPSISGVESLSPPQVVQQIEQKPLRKPLFLCAWEGDSICDAGPLDCITTLAGSILVSLYGSLTCCECCSGNYIDVFTYQKLPICQELLEPNTEMDALPEMSTEEIQTKLAAAREQLKQLDLTLNTRRKTHCCASAFLCPFICSPQAIACVCETWLECERPPQSRRPPPNTKLDLAYQFTLPFLEQTVVRGRLGLEQFLSPPETQRMIDLEDKIIPSLEAKQKA